METQSHRMRNNTTREWKLPFCAEPVRGLFGLDAGELYEFSSYLLNGQPKAILKIGRHRSCDIRLLDPTITTVHCNAIRHGEDWELKDAGSLNGIYANGVRVDSVMLVPRMRIQLGSIHLVAVGDEIQIPLTAASYTSFLAQAALAHPSMREAGKQIKRSPSTVSRGLEKWLAKLGLGRKDVEL